MPRESAAVRHPLPVLTSAKTFAVIAALYALTILLPAAIGSDYHAFPPDVTRRTVMACVLFLLGLGFGTVLFPMSATPASEVPALAFRDGLGLVVAMTAFVALYVLTFGPPAPFFAAFTLTDPQAILMARENAVKLNPDELFVRLYSWGRDIFGPVAFILSVHALRTSREGQVRAIAIVGAVAGTYLALWSGQKATFLNYLLAAFIFSAANVRSMALTAAKVAPLLLALVAWLFWITLPQLVGDPNAQRILVTAITNRVLFAPLAVANAYVEGVDWLRVISPGDAVPYLAFLWSPGILSLENQVGLQYFAADMESTIHANGAAFAYAYVIGGMIGCVLGGVMIMGGLALATRIVRASGSPFLATVFAASLSYMLLDLQNGNFVSYLLKIVVLAVLIWGASAVFPWRTALERRARA